MASRVLERVTPIVTTMLNDLAGDEDLEWEIGTISEPYMIIDDDEHMTVGMEQYVAIWLVLHEPDGDSALTTKVMVPLHLATTENLKESINHSWNHILVSRMEHQFSLGE